MSAITELVAISVAAVLALLLLLCSLSGQAPESFLGFGGQSDAASTYYAKISGLSGVNVAALHCLPTDNVSPGVFLSAVTTPAVISSDIRGFVISQSAIIQPKWISQLPAIAVSTASGTYLSYNLGSSAAIVAFLLNPSLGSKV